MSRPRKDQASAPEGYKPFDPTQPYVHQRGATFALTGIDPSQGVCYRCGLVCKERYEWNGLWYGPDCIFRVSGIPLNESVLVNRTIDIEATAARQAANAAEETRSEIKWFHKDWYESCQEELKRIEAEEAIINAELAKATKHYGTIGEKITIEGECTTFFSFETPNSPYAARGYCTKIKISTSEIFTYWNSIKGKKKKMEVEGLGMTTVYEDDVDKGDVVRIKATVKEHGIDKRNGFKETILQRASLVEMIKRHE